MTTASPVKRSTSSGPTKKSSKKLKTAKSPTATEDAVNIVQESQSAVPAATAEATSHLIRHEAVKEILGEALLVDDDSVTDQDLLLLRNRQPARSGQLQLQGGNDRVQVTCCNYGNRPEPYKYAVALVSATNVRVWDAQVFSLQRSVACVTEAVDDVVRLGAADASSGRSTPLSAAELQINYRDAQNLLGEAFGTRKRKQAIASAAKNQIKVDAMGDASANFISDNLASTAASIMAAGGGPDAGKGDAATTALLPPYDKETGDVSQIYRLADLIPRDVFKALPVMHDMEAVKSTLTGLKDGWLNRFQAILAKTSGAARDQAMRTCVFAWMLATFRQLKEAAINGPDGSVVALQKWIPICPSEVATHILSTFADPLVSAGSAAASITAKTRHKLPPTLRDKAALYVLALLLHLDNFRVNLTRASELLDVPPTKLTAFFKALGCAIEKPAKSEESSIKIGDRMVTVKYARLTAPLKFPLPPKRK